MATHLDSLMLKKSIAPPLAPMIQLELRDGKDVAKELSGRVLLRYVGDRNVHERSHPGPTFVTPTPYSVDDLHAYLALPGPEKLRTHVVWLDPEKLKGVRGPRWCNLGSGIEYELTEGYTEEAILSPGWAVKIR